ncbi:hypothetical protein B0J11DRAFT_471908 [Dendryphion nanum]|uniref:DUF3176 domain containing protein n=1 Tax=Dendryphion nanum TaxID=256645 RepID=A0A9P9IBS2_9PLEO|nr:hypothetical protein B0J11DRAFT_471908 [Dendryphion nanum]
MAYPPQLPRSATILSHPLQEPSHASPLQQDRRYPKDINRPPPPSYKTSAYATAQPLHNSTQRTSAHRESTYADTCTRRQHRVGFRYFRRYKFQKKKDSARPEPTAGLGLDADTWRANETVDEKHVLKSTDTNIAQWIEKKVWHYNSSGGVIRRWLLEIISWVVSAASMTAILIILLHVEGKRVPQWPLSQTLNILSRVVSGALILPVSEAIGQLKWNWFQEESKKMWDFEIFDNASRGPWGSFLLLIRTKGRTLASLGAAVTLLALALDPFFQQVTVFPDRWVKVGMGAIPIVTEFQPNYISLFKGGKPQSFVDSGFRSAVSKFFWENGSQPVPFGSGVRANIPVSCPTGNCTWDLYETLGYCSKCVEVKSLLSQFTCQDSALDWFPNLPSDLLSNFTGPRGIACGYYLNVSSATATLMSGYSLDKNTSSPGPALLSRVMPLLTVPLRKPLFGGSIHFKDIQNPVTDILVVSATGGAESVYRNETPVAHECVLYWCVKTIHSIYESGRYQESVIESFFNSTPREFPWNNSHIITETSNGTIFTQYKQDITIQAPRNRILTTETGVKLQFGSYNETTSANITVASFGLARQPIVATIQVFDEIAPSFYTVDKLSTAPMMRDTLYIKGTASTRSILSNPWLPPNNISQHMERLATAATDYMRSSISHQMIAGDAWNVQQFVEVHWEWLTLQLIVILLTLIFLIATVRKTAKAKDQVGVWKSSALATLVHGGLSEDMKRQIKPSPNIGTPRAKARRLRVQLFPNKGWRVSGKFSPTIPLRNQPPPGWI